MTEKGVKTGAAVNRRELVDIYKFWQFANIPTQSSNIAFLCSFVCGLMLFFDQLFLIKSNNLSAVRGITLAILFSQVFIIRKLKVKYDLDKFGENSTSTQAFGETLVALPAILFTGSYFYIVFFNLTEQIWVYYTGLLLIVLSGAIVLHRFWRAQYIYHILVYAISIVLPFTSKIDHVNDYSNILFVVNTGAVIIGAFFRREFVGNLYSRYRGLKRMVPQKIARFLCVSDENADPSQFFEPKERYTVCLCADWRGFQKLTNTKTSLEITHMLEMYYDEIIDQLQKTLPDSNYFMSWNADELFIVFFDDLDRREKVIKDALTFTNVLISQIYNHVRTNVSSELDFDVGLSEGVGLLGLLGPKQFKKTTIVGNVPGRAKRLESEAKKYKLESPNLGSPVVIMDEALYHFLTVLQISTDSKFEEVIATTKDITNKRFFKWIIDTSASGKKVA